MIYELEPRMNIGEGLRAWPVLETETQERAGYIMASHDGTDVNYEQARSKCHTIKEMEWILKSMRELQGQLLQGATP